MHKSAVIEGEPPLVLPTSCRITVNVSGEPFYTSKHTENEMFLILACFFCENKGAYSCWMDILASKHQLSVQKLVDSLGFKFPENICKYDFLGHVFITLFLGVPQRDLSCANSVPICANPLQTCPCAERLGKKAVTFECFNLQTSMRALWKAYTLRNQNLHSFQPYVVSKNTLCNEIQYNIHIFI